ncbi:hypothetical protein TSAR_013832 [Trichomalopsis sarcophagae]|uniref:Odorant receptor n=1 Tax=Trichomalopsis sarcophagae TaxID=543379 RepID=A0A232F8K7_9HYME|nr:hypothetical protein TSAR_013832 [Trichomalopsis sarcophagae]
MNRYESDVNQKTLTKCKDDLKNASKILTWNKRLLLLLGLWPESPIDFLFCASAVYYIFYLGLDFVSFVLFLRKKILNVSIFIQLLAYGHISARLLLLRRHNKTFGILFTEIKRDYELRNFESDQELRMFLKYNRPAKTMIKMLFICSTFFGVVFYVRPFLTTYFVHRTIRKAHRNVTAPFFWNTYFYKFHKITTINVYAMHYVSEFPFSILTGIISCATDCLVLTLGCHLSGRLAALSHRIRNVDFRNGSQEFKAVIRLHQQVLRRIAEMIEDSLSSLMLCHILVASILMCIVLYKTLIRIILNFSLLLKCLRPGKRIHLINTVILLFLNISRAVQAAFYECKWYTMLLQDRKLIILNLLRSQRPIRFAAGGLGTFSIQLFSEVLKSSLGYLSVLRNIVK